MPLGLVFHVVERGDGGDEQDRGHDCKHAQAPAPIVWEKALRNEPIDEDGDDEGQAEQGAKEASARFVSYGQRGLTHPFDLPPLHAGQVCDNEVAQEIKARLSKCREASTDDISREVVGPSRDGKSDGVEDANQNVGSRARSDVCDFCKQGLGDGPNNLVGNRDGANLGMGGIFRGGHGVEEIGCALIEGVGKHGEDQGDAQDPKQHSAALRFAKELVEGHDFGDADMLIDRFVPSLCSMAMLVF